MFLTWVTCLLILCGSVFWRCLELTYWQVRTPFPSQSFTSGITTIFEFDDVLLPQDETQPILKILYGKIWEEAFFDLAADLRHTFPNFRVEGNPFAPPGPDRALVGLILMLAQVTIFGSVLVQYRPPCVYVFGVVMLVSFTGCVTAVLQFETLVGAFEVYYNDILIWSKLATGQTPILEDLIRKLAQTLAKEDKLLENPSTPTEGEYIYDTKVIPF